MYLSPKKKQNWLKSIVFERFERLLPTSHPFFSFEMPMNSFYYFIVIQHNFRNGFWRYRLFLPESWFLGTVTTKYSKPFLDHWICWVRFAVQPFKRNHLLSIQTDQAFWSVLFNFLLNTEYQSQILFEFIIFYFHLRFLRIASNLNICTYISVILYNILRWNTEMQRHWSMLKPGMFHVYNKQAVAIVHSFKWVIKWLKLRLEHQILHAVHLPKT